MTLVEPRFRGLFLSVFALFALFGTSMTIIGATLPIILANFHWDYLTAGIVLGAGAVAYFLSTFASGYLVKRWGPKPTSPDWRSSPRRPIRRPTRCSAR